MLSKQIKFYLQCKSAIGGVTVCTQFTFVITLVALLQESLNNSPSPCGPIPPTTSPQVGGACVTTPTPPTSVPPCTVNIGKMGTHTPQAVVTLQPHLSSCLVPSSLPPTFQAGPTNKLKSSTFLTFVSKLNG